MGKQRKYGWTQWIIASDEAAERGRAKGATKKWTFATQKLQFVKMVGFGPNLNQNMQQFAIFGLHILG